MINRTQTKDKSKIRKLTSTEIEVAVAEFFNIRQNIIVPNVYWGLGFRYELDLLIISKSNCGYEIEIKVTKSDIKADQKKYNCHNSPRIRELYFAIPDYLSDCLDLIPEQAGVILVDKNLQCKIIKSPRRQEKYYKFTDKEVLKLAKLGTMRIWKLKRQIVNKYHMEGKW